MLCKTVLETVDVLSQRYIAVWEDICNLESPTSDKAGVDAVGRYLENLAREKGWQVERLPMEKAGDPICITMNPQVLAAPITLSGHIDTVHPVGLFGSPAVRREGDFLYGPGVTDCKGGVVAAFLAMDALAHCGFTARPVQLILQTDEETGSLESGKKTVEFMCEKAKGSVAFLNAEPGSTQTAVLSRKGIWRVEFNVHGKASHSADCCNGASAIAEAAHKILRLEQMKDPDGLTCNCGVIRGGTVANTVAAECVFSADIRFANEEQYRQAEEIVKAAADSSQISGCTCQIETVSYRPAMPLVEQNIRLLEAINRIYEANGMPQLAAKHSAGGSDAAYTTEAGIPTVDSLGVEGRYIHSVKEMARISSLAEAAKRLAAVVAAL